VIKVKNMGVIHSRSDNDRVGEGKTARRTRLSTAVNKSVYEE